MSQKVLFVDDEPALLKSIKRLLGSKFNVTTAESGDAALRTMAEQGPFAVVVSDMRMPSMDGVQFIAEAHNRWPDTVYAMLTGNQDQGTAVKALNEGHVFQFLNKPCQTVDLTAVLEAGMRQYQLVTAEKELLQNTFYGAVAVLTDILELTDPGFFSRSPKIQAIVEALQTRLNLNQHWEFRLAARLGLIGFALLPEEERHRFDAHPEPSRDLDEQFRQVAATGQRLIERIPRLETVARIIGMQARVNGDFNPRPKSEDEKALAGATLLRVAIQWDGLMREGCDPVTAIVELKKSLPQLSNNVVTILQSIPAEEVDDDGILVECSDLEEGMVLLVNVSTSDGIMLVRKGRRLTPTVIEKLKCYDSSTVCLQPIRVRTSSVPKSLKVMVAG